MLRRIVTLPLLAILITSLLGAVSATPTRAYGAATWQITVSGTGVAPGTGTALGFWGWCALGGGVESGNNGDCEFAQYFHAAAGSGFTCHLSLDISSWTVGTNGDFLVTGTASVTPIGATGPCLAFFPGSASFSDLDLLIPAAPDHYNLGSLGPGLVGSFQAQVTQVP